MKKILFASAVAVLLGAGAAQAEEGAYFAILGGATWDPGLTVGNTKQGLDTGYNLGARAGYGLDQWGLKNLSVEVDTFFNRSTFTPTTLASRLQSTSEMANLVYHPDLDLPVGLYGGAGLGAVTTDYGNAAASGSSTVLGWQLIGGVDYPVSDDMKLFAEYRYQNAHDVNFGGAPIGNTSNNLSVGMKFHL